MTAFLLAGILSLLTMVPGHAAEFNIASAGAPVAPIDIQNAQRDPYVPMTTEQRQDSAREFRSLLAMGLRQVTFAHWGNREIADCQPAKTVAGRVCEIQMGSSHADYTFYGSGTRSVLHEVEIVVDSDDAGLMKTLKKEARQYAGDRAGEFYLEENDAAGQSLIRFVWKR